ncbi:hypothetical protein [Streptoalloteichus hindustanus]|uniref:Uncharacterized protein n=1 Tax=Streptoalloteichus hindustanus TaxID=2017 RepID=A0A1M5M9K0_STRHI|nr:hypothetical protein [Streptoalloteichus hindustanus]SHG73967.1 hypothetical protein SAMN05444320_11342 [Streptoalloteichus hindustanus]
MTVTDSQPIAVVDLISALDALIDSGDRDQAKKRAAHLIERADLRDLLLIHRCAHVLDRRPRTAVAILRDAWKRSNEHARHVIAAMARVDRRPLRTTTNPDRAPRWTRDTHYQAPRDVNTDTIYTGSSEQRDEIHARTRTTGESASAAAVRLADAYRVRCEYEDTHADENEGWEDHELAGYQLDYVRANVPPLRGLTCVSCWMERPDSDNRRTPDDGLCAPCRDDGRPGIPASNNPVAARCAYLTRTYRTAGLVLLRRYWRDATDTDRAQIQKWTAQHLPRRFAPTRDNLPQRRHHPKDERDLIARLNHTRQLQPTHARSVVSREWKRATPRGRQVIQLWMERHGDTLHRPSTITTWLPEPPAVCQGCGKEGRYRRATGRPEGRYLRRDLCVDCRRPHPQPRPIPTALTLAA